MGTGANGVADINNAASFGTNRGGNENGCCLQLLPYEMQIKDIETSNTRDGGHQGLTCFAAMFANDPGRIVEPHQG